MLKLKIPVDARSAPSRTPQPEEIEVVSFNGEYLAVIAESPQPDTVPVVRIGGVARTVVATAPAAGQCRVKVYNGRPLPLLEFHSSDDGLAGDCDYFRAGTDVTGLSFYLMIRHLQPLYTAYTSVAELAAAVPPSTDLDDPGYPGRVAYIQINGKAFPLKSDGAAWRNPLFLDPETGIIREMTMTEVGGSPYPDYVEV